MPKLASRVVRKSIETSRRARQALFNLLVVENHDYKKSIILSGTGRSGTTWVEELINANNSFRIMFEPFHSGKVELLRNWNYRQYLRPDDRRESYLNSATAILSGNISNHWIDKYNRKLFVRKRLIKDIRTQHILRWIFVNFPEIPIVLILRHPCAVTNSKLKLGWETHLPDFLGQIELMEDYLSPFEDLLQSTSDEFEKHILMWCVENYVPLKQFDEGEILVVFYEDICRTPERELRRIITFVGEEFSQAHINGLTRPSAESRWESAISSGTDLVSSWRDGISNEQIKKAIEILAMFGLDKIYDETDFPLMAGSEALRLYTTTDN